MYIFSSTESSNAMGGAYILYKRQGELALKTLKTLSFHPKFKLILTNAFIHRAKCSDTHLAPIRFMDTHLHTRHLLMPIQFQ